MTVEVRYLLKRFSRTPMKTARKSQMKKILESKIIVHQVRIVPEKNLLRYWKQMQILLDLKLMSNQLYSLNL